MASLIATSQDATDFAVCLYWVTEEINSQIGVRVGVPTFNSPVTQYEHTAQTE